MNIISFICFLTFFLCVITFFRKDSDIFSPGRLFLLVWSLAIGLTNLKFSRHQIEWSLFSWLMLLISLFSFLTGVFIVYVINSNKKIQTISSIRKSVLNLSLNNKLLYKYIIALFIGYLISYAISYLVIGYVPIFTRFPGLFRVNWGIFGFGLLIQAFPTIVLLIFLYYLISKGNKWNKIILGNIFLITFITYALLLQRYYIIFALIVASSILYYGSKFFRLRNVIIIMSSIVAVIYSMNYIRLSSTIVNYLYYLSDMKYSIKYAVFTEPYMYIVMNLENFANAVEKLQNFTYGLFTFDFIFAVTGIKHSIANYMNLGRFPDLITSSFNTFTMFFIYYRDFGIIGLGIIPFIIGMLFSSSYYRMRINPNIHTIVIYSIFVFIILFSFFVPLISFLHFVFNFIIIYYVTKKIIINKSVVF